MEPFLDSWEYFRHWLPAALATLDIILIAVGISWVLMTKPNATSAVAWCLLMIFLPFLGPILYLFFGYQHVTRPLNRKRRHRQRYLQPEFPRDYHAAIQTEHPANSTSPVLVSKAEEELSRDRQLAQLGYRLGGSSVTLGNQVDFYFDGPPAFEAMFATIKEAKHHLHMQSFIFQNDAFAKKFIDALTEKAKQGVEVRLLYDAMGSYFMRQSFLEDFRRAGGKSSVFLPINPLRRRLQINLRNHRKLLIADGQVGYVGGLNVGDEYMGLHRRFGPWRDTHLRLAGPAVCDLQRIFCEDWDFAAGERLWEAGRESQSPYFRTRHLDGPFPIQVLDSGPDRETKAIREWIFAAIVQAKQRVWIASPYFIPDDGLLTAIRLAAFRGVDVRLLHQLYPDKWVPQLAARYYWNSMLEIGVKVYQYVPGMMHAKQILIDRDLVSVGTANLDNRSMFLNFEVNCVLYSHKAGEILEEAFHRDFAQSILLTPQSYANRPFAARLLENAARLLSPVL